MDAPMTSAPLVAELDEPVQHHLVLATDRGLEHGQPDLDFSGLPLDVGQMLGVSPASVAARSASWMAPP
jgi:hypothetical protein